VSPSKLVVGDCLEVLRALPEASVHACVTSPPYWGLRDYGVAGQIGAERTVEHYVASLISVFREVRRVLRPSGTLWLNIGDSYTSGGRTWRDADKKNPARGMTYRAPTPAGLKPKDLIGIPWKLAFALQADGWYLRSDIIWSKPNPQPESVKDRPTRAHEYVFLLSKSERYFYDADAVKEPAVDGRSKRARRSVWTIQSEPLREAHFATFPPKLVEPCVLASTKRGEVVLDPFFGSGTVGVVAEALGRSYVGIELNEDYADIARRRLRRNAAPARGEASGA
jgi:site-specific DNA-methyltransferase (adenine-specific)/site-specific DNA-methyltransferase (cytosine-N4-specific)